MTTSAVMNVGDYVRATSGPYEGRAGIIKSCRNDGLFEVVLFETSYDTMAVGVFDRRCLICLTGRSS